MAKAGDRNVCAYCSGVIIYNEGERTVMGQGSPWWAHIDGTVFCGGEHGSHAAATPANLCAPSPEGTR